MKTQLRCGSMNLLPKSSKEFGSVDYWEKFFQQHGKKAFEWYGTYLELCGVLHKYIKPREKVSTARRPVCVGKVGTAFRESCTWWTVTGVGPQNGAHNFRISYVILATRQLNVFF